MCQTNKQKQTIVGLFDMKSCQVPDQYCNNNNTESPFVTYFVCKRDFPNVVLFFIHPPQDPSNRVVWVWVKLHEKLTKCWTAFCIHFFLTAHNFVQNPCEARMLHAVLDLQTVTLCLDHSVFVRLTFLFYFLNWKYEWKLCKWKWALFLHAAQTHCKLLLLWLHRKSEHFIMLEYDEL